MRLISSLCLLVTASCTSGDWEDTETGTETAALGKPCGLMCGSNSATVDGVRFWELHPNLPNSSGVSVVEVLDGFGDDAGTLRVVDGALAGVKNATVYPLFKNGRIIVYVEDSKTYHQLTVEEHATAKYWVAPNATIPMRTSRIVATLLDENMEPKRDPEELCPDAAPGGLPDGHFVVFSGDRYEADRKTVKTGKDAGEWINIACDGSAPMKLHANRHTSDSGDSPYIATNAERQAMLKMYVADYCGEGEEHTVNGHPLEIINDKSWAPSLSPGFVIKGKNQFLGLTSVESVEAVWDADGALCLDEPRYAKKGDIKCELKSCFDWPNKSWKSHGSLLTGNPK